MPAFKVSFFLTSVQEASVYDDSELGWTENWYYEDDATFDGVFRSADVQSYMTLRRLCMPSIYRFSWVRISRVDLPRSFKVFAIMAGRGTLAAEFAAQVQCAVLVDMERGGVDAGEPAHHKRFLMRGLSNKIINGNVIDTSSPIWNNVTSFLDFIARRAAGEDFVPGIPHVTKLGMQYRAPGAVKTRLISVATNSLNVHEVDLTPQIALLNRGDPVEIRGVRTMPQLNKVWSYQSAVGEKTQLGTIKQPLPVGFSTGFSDSPVAIPLVYRHGTLDQYTIIGLRNKKTGKSFRQLRGKS